VDINGRDIVSRIDDALKRKIKNRKWLMGDTGVKSIQSFTDWYKGSLPSADVALRVADKLGLSIRYLLTGKEENGLSCEERELIEIYRSLPDTAKVPAVELVRAYMAGVNAGKTV